MPYIIHLPQKIKLYILTAAVLFAALTPECFSQEKQANLAKQDSLIAAAREIIGMQTYCALVTIDSCREPQSRTMNPFPPENDITVWIATNSRSK
ncbi:MAG: hypothetical protein JXA06_02020 [Bacteroidetes bacterium]|nr:hypothetical protein [Bacteroidota bacterium]